METLMLAGSAWNSLNQPLVKDRNIFIPCKSRFHCFEDVSFFVSSSRETHFWNVASIVFWEPRPHDFIVFGDREKGIFTFAAEPHLYHHVILHLTTASTNKSRFATVTMRTTTHHVHPSPDAPFPASRRPSSWTMQWMQRRRTTSGDERSDRRRWGECLECTLSL